MKNNIIIVYGPMGIGKTKLINKLTLNENNVLWDNMAGEHTPKEYLKRIKKIKQTLRQCFNEQKIIKTLVIEGCCNCIEELLMFLAGESIPVEKIFIEIATNSTISNLNQFACELSIIKVEQVKYYL